MEVVIVEDATNVAERAAAIFCDTLHKKPNAVLGLATGSTPVATYQQLIKRYRAGDVSFRAASSFNLDEYVGLEPSHPQSYRSFMQAQLFDHVDIDVANTHVPPGMAENPMEAGPEYEQAIVAAGGIDLQILGIGTNGHIGFNEPTSSLGSRTRLKTLTPSTVADNSRFFKPDEFQPALALTMGIQTILEARRVLLLATGENKAQAIADAVEGPLAGRCPASALQLHANTSFIIDEAAASKLEMRDYYKFVLEKQDGMIERFGDPRSG